MRRIIQAEPDLRWAIKAGQSHIFYIINISWVHAKLPLLPWLLDRRGSILSTDVNMHPDSGLAYDLCYPYDSEPAERARRLQL